MITICKNFVKALENNLTPVVWKTGESMAHALVIDSIQKTDQNESFYICKNTVKENGEYTYKFPTFWYEGMKPSDDMPEIQEAFFFHFNHVKISETELSKRHLQSHDQPSRLDLKADFEKYNDIQAISNLASVVQSKSLAEEFKKIESENKLTDGIINQYRKLELNNDANNDLISSLSNRYECEPKGILDSESISNLKVNFTSKN